VVAPEAAELCCWGVNKSIHDLIPRKCSRTIDLIPRCVEDWLLFCFLIIDVYSFIKIYTCRHSGGIQSKILIFEYNLNRIVA
jgi:hypothetical protein